MLSSRDKLANLPIDKILSCDITSQHILIFLCFNNVQPCMKQFERAHYISHCFII